jgi:hypothetical protein
LNRFSIIRTILLASSLVFLMMPSAIYAGEPPSFQTLPSGAPELIKQALAAYEEMQYDKALVIFEQAEGLPNLSRDLKITVTSIERL